MGMEKVREGGKTSTKEGGIRKWEAKEYGRIGTLPTTDRSNREER
jgi:hypothetical protein